MNRGEARAANAGKAAGLLSHADNELLDVFRCIPEHLRAAGVGVDLGTAIDRFHGAVGIAAAALKPRDHGRQALTAEAGLGIEDASQGFQLLPFDLGNEFTHSKLVGLDRQIGLAIASFDDVARGQPTVIGGYALCGDQTGQQAKRQDMRQARLQCRPPAHLEA